MSKSNKGWFRHINGRKYHYFINGMSLCGNWFALGGELDDSLDEHPDNCKKCQNKKLKQKVSDKGN